MYQVRHKSCNARLFDCRWEHVEVNSGTVPDLKILCRRCRNRADFRLKLPKSLVPRESKPIFCTNLSCMKRLADFTQSVTYLDRAKGADISILCNNCKTYTYLQIAGLVRIAEVKLTYLE